MKRKAATWLTGLTPLLMAAPVGAQSRPAVPLTPQIDNSRPDWENPAVFDRGKEPARATGFPFEDSARAGGRSHGVAALPVAQWPVAVSFFAQCRWGTGGFLPR